MTTTISFDADRLTRELNDFGRNQVPFAMALALTRTVEEAREEARNRLPSQFTIRNTWVSKGFRVERARKDNLVSTLWHKDAYMGLQQSGGEKRPKAAKSVAIPHGDRFPGARGTIAGKTSRSKWPGNIKRRVYLKDRSDPSTVFEFQRTGRRTRGKVGKHHIDRRFGPRQKDPNLKLMYVLKRGVRVTPRLDLDGTVVKVARARMAVNFKGFLEHAMRTAK